MIGYAAIGAGLALVATSFVAPNLAKAVANAALISAVVALLFVGLPLLEKL